MAEVWHGMYELTRHGMAGEPHGNGMGAASARHGMCELAFSVVLGMDDQLLIIYLC
jgi:hypothetical protein